MNDEVQMKQIAGLAVATSAQAAVVNWSASIDASQEVPINPSTGTGVATGTVNTVTGALSWLVSFSGMTGPLTGMHIHGPAAPGTNAGVVVNLGAISGLTSPSSGLTVISAPVVSDLLAGLLYINLHTATFGGGEIRGQISAAVPLPLTAPLVVSAFALLGLLGRRRRG
jgi:hypothetical protein